MEKVVATGKGKYDVSFADDRYTEGVTLAMGALHLCPGDHDRGSVWCGRDSGDYHYQRRKSGGVGAESEMFSGTWHFPAHMARRLDMPLEEMGAVPIEGLDIAVSDGCTLFAGAGRAGFAQPGELPAGVAACRHESSGSSGR